MLEWLVAGPLLGIGTTIGFFVFLIIGHYICERRLKSERM